MLINTSLILALALRLRSMILINPFLNLSWNVINSSWFVTTPCWCGRKLICCAWHCVARLHIHKLGFKVTCFMLIPFAYALALVEKTMLKTPCNFHRCLWMINLCSNSDFLCIVQVRQCFFFANTRMCTFFLVVH